MIQDTDEQIERRAVHMMNRRHLFCMLDELYNKSILETTKSFGKGSIVGWRGEERGLCYFQIRITFVNNIYPEEKMNIGVKWADFGQTATLVDKVSAAIIDRLVEKHQGRLPIYRISPVGIVLQK